MINKRKKERERNRDHKLKRKYCSRRHNIHVIWQETEYQVDPIGLVWGSGFQTFCIQDTTKGKPKS